MATFKGIVCRMEVDIVEKSPRRVRGDYSTLLFSTARSFIGYFEITWHLTVKLFFAKISERAKLQHLWRTRGHSRVTVPRYPGMLAASEIYFL